MSTTHQNNPQRIDELMVDAATQGLSPQDQAELSSAIERDPALAREAEAYELAVAAVDEALTRPGRGEALPAALRDKLLAAAPALGAPAHLRLAGTPRDASNPPEPGFSWTDGRAFGWYAAAAALVALAVLLIQAPQPRVVEKLVEVPVPAKPDEAPPIAEQYAALASDAKTVSAAWGFNADGGDARFANATGEVIWNSEQQAGYMKLAGLPANDPSVEQYQLWIVDPARDAEPIDGGVFDINAQGEVIVPIDAKLRSDSPAVFAITIEQPGGVVVSEGPLQVIAAVKTTS